MYRVRAGTFQTSEMAWILFAAAMVAQAIMPSRFIWLFTLVEIVALLVAVVDYRKSVHRTLVIGDRELIFADRVIVPTDIENITYDEVRSYFSIYLTGTRRPFRVHVGWKDAKPVWTELQEWWVRNQEEGSAKRDKTREGHCRRFGKEGL